MLVSFSAKNYKSFYDEVILDMRIDTDNANIEEIKNNPFVHKINDDYISKLCILYGHNASGKSNLLNAISYLIDINIFYDFFVSYKELLFHNMIYGKDENTEFILEFYYSNLLYHYNIILDNKNIKYELLQTRYNYDAKDNTIIFERENNSIKNGNEFFKNIKGIPNQITVMSYCNSVDDYREYIEEYRNILARVFLQYPFRNFPEALFLKIDDIYNLLKENNIWSLYKKLISLADVGIDDIEVIKNVPDNRSNYVLDNFSNIKNKYKLISVHKNYKDDFRKIESDGTKNYANNLFSILGTLENGNLLILDEFNGVQSEILELVICLFQKNMFEDIQNDTSQLILSTHDTNLMSLKNTLLNHYWFLNKEDNKSELYCASDFEDLKKEDLEKEYKRNSLKAKYNSRLFELPSKFYLEDHI